MELPRITAAFASGTASRTIRQNSSNFDSSPPKASRTRFLALFCIFASVPAHVISHLG